MPQFASQDFREGLAIGLALNGKIIQPDLNANIWKYAMDSISLVNITLGGEAWAVTFPSAISPVNISDSMSLSLITLSDAIGIIFS